jgi:RNA polymerase sigma-70 factor (ECF subfamily)
MERDRNDQFEPNTECGEPLARRLANGDPSAPRELVERHHAELYRYAMALLRHASAAEDAVQDSFERAFLALGKYPQERIEALALRAWLYRITLNVVRNMWRDNREITLVEMPSQPGSETVAESAFASGADRETWLDTLDALGRLSERQRVAVTLRYLEDLPFAEIAAATGWPENTCKTLVRRGTTQLATLLSINADGKGDR